MVLTPLDEAGDCHPDNENRTRTDALYISMKRKQFQEDAPDILASVYNGEVAGFDFKNYRTVVITYKDQVLGQLHVTTLTTKVLHR